MKFKLTSGAVIDLMDEGQGRLQVRIGGYGEQLNRTTMIEPEEVAALTEYLVSLSDPDTIWGLVRNRMTHKLYTLREARQKIAEEICAEEGHDLDQEVLRADRNGKPIKEIIVCERCHKQFSEVVPG